MADGTMRQGERSRSHQERSSRQQHEHFAQQTSHLDARSAVTINIRQPLPALFNAVEQLWTTTGNEENAIKSKQFETLERVCFEIYTNDSNSRLYGEPDSKLKLQAPLTNFFRWSGAPWHPGERVPANLVAYRLHEALMMTKVVKTHFAPLDQLTIEDSDQPYSHIQQPLHFGPNEIAHLSSAELGCRIDTDVLNRFGAPYSLDLEKFDDRFWLISSEEDESGLMSKRAHQPLYELGYDELDKIRLFPPLYPKVIEDALFVILLHMTDSPPKEVWQLFSVPWTYSRSDDPFAIPPFRPDPLSLSWTMTGGRDWECEIPDHHGVFSANIQQFRVSLKQRWSQFQIIAARDGSSQANFHPLTKHFFVKALQEEGVDELLSHLSCLEATFMLNEFRGRKKLINRINNFLGCFEQNESIIHAYKLRDNYLHSLGQLDDHLTFHTLSNIRTIIIELIRRYIDKAEASDLNREQLLRSLD